MERIFLIFYRLVYCVYRREYYILPQNLLPILSCFVFIMSRPDEVNCNLKYLIIYQIYILSVTTGIFEI